MTQEQFAICKEVEELFALVVEDDPMIGDMYYQFTQEMEGAVIPRYLFNLVFLKDVVIEYNARLTTLKEQMIPTTN